MKKNKSIQIIGAGLSGMVAGISLAREGYRVTVSDAQKTIGGSPLLHPSVHTTPAQLPELCEYTGIDFTGAFVPCDPYPVFYNKTRRLSFPSYVKYNRAYCVERGPRPSSIDTILYKLAVKEGVKFEFGRKADFSSLKAGTIVATGLDTAGYEAFGVPCRLMYGAWSFREIKDRSATGNIYMGPFSTDYGYTAQAHGLDYNLLFSRKPVTDNDIAAYRATLKKIGIADYTDPWRRVTMAVPAAVRLFAGDMILAGTLSGMIEPFWGYGIVGAIISGRLAAQAVTDRNGAEWEFKRFNRGFDRKFMRRDRFSSYSSPVRSILIDAGLTWARLQCRFDKKLASGPREPLKWFR
jgi:flavin-dependent dehydrogenase